ncbi:hypothetical protein Csa_023874, partial [Cucumis sativus]
LSTLPTTCSTKFLKEIFQSRAGSKNSVSNWISVFQLHYNKCFW